MIKEWGAMTISSATHRWVMWAIVIVLAIVVSVVAGHQTREGTSRLILGAITTASHPTFLVDEEGIIAFANPQAIALLGGQYMRDVWGHNVTEFMDERVAELHRKHFREKDLDNIVPGKEVKMMACFKVRGESVVMRGVATSGVSDGNVIYRLEFVEVPFEGEDLPTIEKQSIGSDETCPFKFS